MSQSELWIVDRNWSGNEYKEYQNSWLFCPVIANVLMCQHIDPNERKLLTGETVDNFIAWLMCGGLSQDDMNKKFNQLNDIIMDGSNENDKILWDLSNLGVFNAQDKQLVSDSICQFLSDHKDYFDTCDDCIIDRFKEVAEDIKDLPRRCKYFVIHGSSCDDNVEYWFYRKRLSSWKERVCDFVIIKDGKIAGYKDNLEFFGERT